MMRRIVFLDFDGVIMTAATYNAAAATYEAAVLPVKPTWREIGVRAREHMDADLVANLSELCVRAEADIVLSTSWRGQTEEDRAELEAVLWERGLARTVQVLGQTPSLLGASASGRLAVPFGRGREIEAWLNQHRPGWERARVLILDDNNDMDPLLDRLIRTTFADGFTRRHLDRALMRLGVPAMPRIRV